jgi:hypothetical protein
MDREVEDGTQGRGTQKIRGEWWNNLVEWVQGVQGS